MSKEESILKYSHGEKSIKVSFIVYADTESLLNKICTCHNNPKYSSTIKKNKQRPLAIIVYTFLFLCHKNQI